MLRRIEGDRVDIDRVRLSEAEMEVVDRIGDAWRAFAKLDVYHPSDTDEFAFHVHALGRIVMGRGISCPSRARLDQV
jgi:hypothetical protein